MHIWALQNIGSRDFDFTHNAGLARNWIFSVFIFKTIPQVDLVLGREERGPTA